ncbi:hypothetical protein BU26DRAFT_412777 [Trematosphaeria pertusa]|uniref:Methyltransferase domain-containing protein n=1 Tax=Trematosphaeria pertusa TaxID=390896 RepID=A0A6A6IYH3_9PLEO|nr:uncharacterized protein BU26DRAFT_412777 [Trematosphaeria pertusa]KAF2255595.1 hypothetical protein BU26DRAFT_412777 [Trematosphaeria pertusa]
MPPAPPSFGSREYWEKRFTSNSNPFEWLEAPTALDPYLVAALKETTEPELELLHIGCGTSLLSYHLRAHVPNPEHIHNLDYSEVAIEVGRKRERQTSKSPPPDAQEPRSASYMRWSAANLLDYSSLLEACKPSAYSIIVDKSTSDSIACSEDLVVPLPYHITATPNPASNPNLTESPEPLHPLHILGVHLALLTKPKARWISLSYSMDRYPFIPLPPPTPLPARSGTGDASTPAYESEPIPTPTGFPDPSTLWTLIGKYDIEVPQPQSPSGSNGSTTTHRPKVMHWVYVLERTNVKVFARRES